MAAVSGTLQAAATITATETLIGAEISCGHYSRLTLFLDYDKGDEAGVYIIPYIMQAAGGAAYQWQDWTAAAGDKSAVESRLYMTASDNYYITTDVTGVEYIKFMQDANGGTPTGVLAVAYTMTVE